MTIRDLILMTDKDTHITILGDSVTDIDSCISSVSVQGGALVIRPVPRIDRSKVQSWQRVPAPMPMPVGGEINVERR